MESDEKPLYSFKITVIGDGRVGKSSLIQKYTENSFNEDYLKTLGANFSLYDKSIDDCEIRLIFWDIAGQDDFSFLRPSFFNNSRASIIVYSLEGNSFGRSSMEHVSDWHKDVLQHCGDVPVVLFANKSDLISADQVDHAQIQSIVEREKLNGYYVTSAKTGEGVLKAFDAIIQNLYEKYSQFPSI